MFTSAKIAAVALAVTLAASLATPHGGYAQTGKQWAFSVSLQETGGENSMSFSENDSSSLITDSLTTRITFGNAFRKSQLLLDGWISANAHRREYDASWPSYGGSFSWSYQGTRFGTRFVQAVNSGLNSGNLAAVGVIPTRINSWRIETLGGISYNFSSRTSFSLDFNYDRTGFENLEPLEDSQFVLEAPPFESDLSNVIPEPPETESEELPVPPDSQQFILDVIASEGLLSPNLSSESARMSAALLHRLSSRTRFSASFYGGYRSFDSTARLNRLKDGFDFGGQASMSRLLTARDSLFLLYRLRQNTAQIPATLQQSLTMGWGRTLRQRLPEIAIQAQGGVSYLRATEVSFNDVVPVADIGLATKLSRSTELGVHFRSGHNETLGFGRTLRTNFLVASLSQSFASRAQISVSAGYAIGNELIRQNTESGGDRYGAQFSLRIVSELSLGASYQRVGRQPRSVDSFRTQNDLWTIYVSYNYSWPRKGSR